MTGDERGVPGEGRSRPQYGEYADDAEQPSEQTPSTDAEPGEPGAQIAPADSPPAPAHPGSRTASPAAATLLPGVPHNLGVNGSSARPAAPTASASHGAPPHGAPYQAPPPAGAQQATQAPPTDPQTPQQLPEPHAATAAPRRGVADRVITILLLGFGAFGALNIAFQMLQFAPNMNLAAAIFGIENFAAPQAVSTIGAIGAVLILTLYAVTLIFSIQRLRARKLTFWVPLSAGAIAFILHMVLTLIAFSQSPELLQAMSDPNALSKLLEYSGS